MWKFPKGLDGRKGCEMGGKYGLMYVTQHFIDISTFFIGIYIEIETGVGYILPRASSRRRIYIAN